MEEGKLIANWEGPFRVQEALDNDPRGLCSVRTLPRPPRSLRETRRNPKAYTVTEHSLHPRGPHEKLDEPPRSTKTRFNMLLKYCQRQGPSDLPPPHKANTLTRTHKGPYKKLLNIHHNICP
ncbi:hypothetical protein CR513_52367, partial [Mucuna pruriens]